MKNNYNFITINADYQYVHQHYTFLILLEKPQISDYFL